MRIAKDSSVLLPTHALPTSPCFPLSGEVMAGLRLSLQINTSTMGLLSWALDTSPCYITLSSPSVLLPIKLPGFPFRISCKPQGWSLGPALLMSEPVNSLYMFNGFFCVNSFVYISPTVALAPGLAFSSIQELVFIIYSQLIQLHNRD